MSPSSEAPAQYRAGDCITLTRVATRNDSVTVIAVVDSCKGTTDTIIVNGTALTSQTTVLRAPSDSSLVFRVTKGTTAWIRTITQHGPDTIWFQGRRFISPIRYDTSYQRTTTPDTIRFLIDNVVYWDDIVGKPIENIFFLHEEDPGIVGYESLLGIPAEDPQRIDTITVTAGTSPVAGHKYSTRPLSPGFIPAGKWIFHPYLASSGSIGTTEMQFRVLHRDKLGVETEMFTVSSGDIDNAVFAEFELESYQPQQVIHDSDRIVLQVIATTTAVPAQSVYMSYEGDSLYTHLHLPAGYLGTTGGLVSTHGDSIRVLYDRLAVMPGLTFTGLVDRIAAWADDSTLTFTISIDSLESILNKAAGRRDSTWFGEYDIPGDAWALPEYLDEGPYPPWYTTDWKRYDKYGVYINETAYPFQLVWHLREDSVAVFEIKMPRARLLDFLGIDSVATSIGPRLIGLVYPDSGSNWTTFQDLALNDSTRNFKLFADAGITFKPVFTSDTKDTLLFFVSIDYDVLWNRIRDSVLANAVEGGSGSTTFTGLTDTPSSYSGQAGKVVSVKNDESGLEFTPAPTGGGGGSSFVAIDTTGTWIDSVRYHTVEFMAPVTHMRQGRQAVADSLSWYRTGWYEYIFPVDFPYPLSTRLGKGHNCYYLELVSDSANGVFFTGSGEFDALTYDTDYSFGVSTHGVTRTEGAFSNNWGVSSSYGYSTVQGYKRVSVTGSMDSLTWYVGSTLDPATMTPRVYRHLLMVSGSGTTLATFLGSMRIRIYFHQRQGYSSSWYIKPLSWRLYRQWK